MIIGLQVQIQNYFNGLKLSTQRKKHKCNHQILQFKWVAGGKALLLKAMMLLFQAGDKAVEEKENYSESK